MGTLEQKITTQATKQDLATIQLVVKGMDMYDGYYGKLSKMKMVFNYKEYSTLKEDLKSFANGIEISFGSFNIKELASLKRSLIMLRHKYLCDPQTNNKMFKYFLDDSINNMDNWIDEIINEIVSETENG